LDSATYKDKREILDMLAIKVVATRNQVTINGVIPVPSTIQSDENFSPTRQTSGCRLVWTKFYQKDRYRHGLNNNSIDNLVIQLVKSDR